MLLRSNFKGFTCTGMECLYSINNTQYCCFGGYNYSTQYTIHHVLGLLKNTGRYQYRVLMVVIIVWGHQRISWTILIILNKRFISHQNSKHVQIPELMFLQLSNLTNFIAHTDQESTQSSKPTLVSSVPFGGDIFDPCRTPISSIIPYLLWKEGS